MIIYIYDEYTNSDLSNQLLVNIIHYPPIYYIIEKFYKISKDFIIINNNNNNNCIKEYINIHFPKVNIKFKTNINIKTLPFISCSSLWIPNNIMLSNNHIYKFLNLRPLTVKIYDNNNFNIILLNPNKVSNWSSINNIKKIQENDNNLKLSRDFNTLTIIDNKYVKKESFTQNAKKMLQLEINWYEYLNSLNIKTIRIYETKENFYTMDFIKSDNIGELFITSSNKEKINIINIIINELEKLHIHKKNVKNNELINDLKEETYIKIQNRHNSVKELIKSYGNIEYVNDIKIKPLNVIMDKIYDILYNYYKDMNYYSIIHGDCVFPNILKHKNKIYLIDPRGKFGNSKIYGPKEYDYGKLLHCLYGHYEYNNNLNLDFVKLENKLILKLPIHKLNYKFNFINKISISFMIVNWLGNSGYFKNNFKKCIFSHYYGLYLGTKLLF